jgi:hypothetical protein
MADYLYELNMALECGGFRFEEGNFKGNFVGEICRNKTKLCPIAMNRAKLPELQTRKAAENTTALRECSFGN